MHCAQCGAINHDNAWKCVQCGEVLQAPPPRITRVEIPNYLVQAILVTIFCFLPCGIPAIIFAAQVSAKIAAGDIDGAMDASRKAKMWCWIAFGVGILLVLGGILVGTIMQITFCKVLDFSSKVANY